MYTCKVLLGVVGNNPEYCGSWELLFAIATHYDGDEAIVLGDSVETISFGSDSNQDKSEWEFEPYIDSGPNDTYILSIAFDYGSNDPARGYIAGLVTIVEMVTPDFGGE
jgi:hypothetical protein